MAQEVSVALIKGRANRFGGNLPVVPLPWKAIRLHPEFYLFFEYILFIAYPENFYISSVYRRISALSLNRDIRLCMQTERPIFCI